MSKARLNKALRDAEELAKMIATYIVAKNPQKRFNFYGIGKYKNCLPGSPPALPAYRQAKQNGWDCENRLLPEIKVIAESDFLGSAF